MTRHSTGNLQSYLRTVAANLAQKLGKRPEDFRYVEIRFHDGQQWTVTTFWQYQENGQWFNVRWTETQF
ncbi:MAG: hypothetical protein KDB03_21945 [Planctomycetales bacterium]|nr:hypothetical protein [Planctomycetales bacterium]